MEGQLVEAVYVDPRAGCGYNPEPGWEGVEVGGEEGGDGGAVVGAVLLSLVQPVHQHQPQLPLGQLQGRQQLQQRPSWVLAAAAPAGQRAAVRALGC